MVTGTRPAPRVLVADDDDLVRLVLRRALERSHVTVIEVSSGSSTEEIADQSFDLAIVDAHMPGSSLAQCLTALRRTDPDLPLLVISGDAQAPVGPELPDFTFLSKPVNLDLFLATVATLLDER
jgi:DNA-binding NtrC family response regulator